MLRLISLVFVFLLTACGESIVPAPRAGDTHQLPEIEWRIRSQAELEAVYENSGHVVGQRNSLKGFVGLDGTKWVVYTPPPQTVDDEVACTLGHEVMHIALGPYHKEHQ